MRSHSISVLLLFLFGAAHAAAQSPTYQVVEIDPDMEYGNLAAALNNHGEVVGKTFVSPADTQGVSHAYLYSDGVMTDLHVEINAVDPTPDSWNISAATDINDNGEIVGFRRQDPIGFKQPFHYAPESGATILNPLGLSPLFLTGAANGINADGDIVGRAGRQAFLLPFGSSDGIPLTDGEAFAVNDARVAVGTTPAVYPDRFDGFAYDPVVGVINLDELYPEVGASFTPTAVNADGDIVGFVSRTESTVEAVVFDLAVGDPSGWRSLGSLDGHPSYAYRINAHGDVVGTVHTGGSYQDWRAVLWLEGAIYGLNDLLAGDPGVVLTEGVDINDNGQIVARGYRVSDSRYLRRSYLLAPADPATHIGELVVFIEGLNLPHGIENALLVKLRDALAELEAGVVSNACGLLGAFANQVEAQSGEKIPADDAEEAVEQATGIREMLGCL